MIKDSYETRFNESLSRWTLVFHDPEVEDSFLKSFGSNLRLPALFRFFVYTAMLSHVVYRIYAIYTIQANVPIKTGTLAEELGTLVIMLVVITAEAMLKIFGWLKWIHGFFLYTAYPVLIVYAGFYTQKAPVLGVTYFFVLCN